MSIANKTKDAELKTFFTTDINEFTVLSEFKQMLPTVSEEILTLAKARQENILRDDGKSLDRWSLRQLRQRYVNRLPTKIRACGVVGDDTALNRIDRKVLDAVCRSDSALIIDGDESAAAYNLTGDLPREIFRKTAKGLTFEMSENSSTLNADIPNVSCAGNKCTIIGDPAETCLTMLTSPIPNVKDSKIAKRLLTMGCGGTKGKISPKAKLLITESLIATANEQEEDKTISFLTELNEDDEE